MSGGHLVRPAGDVELVAPTAGWAGSATGYRRSTAVGEDTGAVHTGFVISELDPGGSLPWHVHSYEESFYVVTGRQWWTRSRDRSGSPTADTAWSRRHATPAAQRR